jgi:tetratricopeptide (TPR) repeat protein
MASEHDVEIWKFGRCIVRLPGEQHWRHLGQRKYDDVETVYRDALGQLQRIRSGDRAMRGVFLNKLGNLYEVQGRYEEAQATYRQAVAAFEPAGDANVGRLAQALKNVAGACSTLDCPNTAALYKRALALREKTAPVSVSVAEIANDLADLSDACPVRRPRN